jgi:type IV pilus assembly protein PilE
MQAHLTTRRPGPAGFTLVEMMVVVVIFAILLSFAIPSYMSQVRQSRRTDARTAVLDLAGREERYFSTNGASYTNVATNLGYTGVFPQAIGSGYYNLTVCVVAVGGAACAPSAAAGPAFTVTATPVAGSSQAKDAACQSFSVDSTGAQFAVDGSANNTSTQCWSQ